MRTKTEASGKESKRKGIEMGYGTESKENIKDWLMKRGKGQEKMEGSSYEGYIYKTKSVTLHKEFTIDLRFVDDDFMKLELYPGIAACSKDFVPVLAMYCLGVSTPAGCLYVDSKANEVVYASETFCIDNAITPETMTNMEEIGKAVVERHYDNLQKLAAGNWIGISAPSCDYGLTNEKVCNSEAWSQNIRNLLLSNQGRNAVCESVCPNDSTSYYLQNYADKDAFNIELRISNGFLVMKGFYGRNGIVCPEEYKLVVAEYFRKYNEVHMLGGMKLGTNGEPCHFEICTSLLNAGEIGSNTIESMEGFLMNALSKTAPDLQKLTLGFPVIGDEKDEFAANKLKRKSELLGLHEEGEKGANQGLLELLMRAREAREKGFNEESGDALPQLDEDAITMDKFMECMDEDGTDDADEEED